MRLRMLNLVSPQQEVGDWPLPWMFLRIPQFSTCLLDNVSPWSWSWIRTPDPWPFPRHDCPPLPPPPPTTPSQAETVTQVGKHLHLFIQPLPLTCPTSSPSPSSTIWWQTLDHGSQNYSIKPMEGSEKIIYCRTPLSAAPQPLFLFLAPASDTCGAQGHLVRFPSPLCQVSWRIWLRVTKLLMQLQFTRSTCST